MIERTNDNEKEHIEKHFTSSELVRDIVIGMSDGLTVPFALAAGLSGAVSTNNYVVIAGLAEIAAGSIAMGLGGFLAARTDSEHYFTEKRREEWEISNLAERERQEVEEVFLSWGLEGETLVKAVDAVCSDKERWIEFMMKHELALEEPNPKRARNSSLTIGLSYIVGGLIPLSPYMLIRNSYQALMGSVIFTLIALFVFGWVKGRFTGTSAWKSAGQTTLVGGLAAIVAFTVAKIIS
jgi:VIT1/CCC1 family predicted Fe2+/Mn2+ transporter